MYRIIRADRRHIPDINRLIKEAKLGDGFEINRPIKNFWIVRVNKIIIACAGMDFYGDSAILTYCVVEKSFRHQGIARSLINHRIDVALNNQKKIVALATMYYTYNLYKKWGFRSCPREYLPESIRDYWQFTSKRYKKCGVMFLKLN